MLEKEERILHIVQKLDGRFVGENHITRAEAIHRMAKALSEIRCANYTHFMKDAEAALNALLEDKK